jgi:hypothetical protein
MWPLQPEPRPQRASTSVDEDVNWSVQPEPAPRPAADIAPRAPASDRFVGAAPDLARGPGEAEAPAAQRRNGESRRAAPAPAVQPISEHEDQNLADMAHRLESVLRPRKAAEPEPSPPPAPRAEAAPAEPKAVRPEPKPAPKPAFDSLEQEMASLLGRPSGKA